MLSVICPIALTQNMSGKKSKYDQAYQKTSVIDTTVNSEVVAKCMIRSVNLSNKTIGNQSFAAASVIHHGHQEEHGLFSKERLFQKMKIASSEDVGQSSSADANASFKTIHMIFNHSHFTFF